MSQEQKEENARDAKELTCPDKPRTPAAVHVGVSPQGGLVPTDLEGLWRLATIMAKSGFMPKGIETQEAVFVAVQMGLEVGLSPMQAVQNIAVINGRPAIWGDAQLGLVEGSGVLEVFKEQFEGDFPRDDFKAICIARRRGRSELITNEFSIADARRAGLWDKSGPWKQYPKRMLKMRARSFTLRDGFADVLKGLKSIEEVRDYPLSGADLEMELGDDGKYVAAEPVIGGTQNQQPPNGNGTAQTPEDSPAGNFPRRSRRNRFTGLSKDQWPAGKIETCGIRPEQITIINKLVTLPENATWLAQYLSQSIGYPDATYLREEEALFVLQNLKPLPAPVQDSIASQAYPRPTEQQKPEVLQGEDNLPKSQPQTSAPPAQQTMATPPQQNGTSNGDDEPMIDCPMFQDRFKKSYCLENCRTRKQDGFCLVLGERPPASGMFGGR